jgi:protein-tyrosine phosphatase
MAGYVDIHAHILPGIDDGPEDLAGSLDMARAAADSGITTLVATPHLRADFPNVHVGELADCCQALQDAIDREQIPLRIVSGAEVSLAWALDASDEELKRASYGQRGTDLLIETPSNLTMIDRHLYTLRLRANGFRITLAHPERSQQFHSDPERLLPLSEQGVLLEVNAESLLFRRRSAIRKLAEHLCRTGQAHALASDAHRAASHRPVTGLAEAVQAAAALVGGARAEWMATAVPAAIIAGESLPEAPDIETSRRLPSRLAPVRRRSRSYRA